jgi:hypothetical protein
MINKLKNVPCLDCNNKYPPYVMDFDHRDKGEKRFSIAWGIRYQDHVLLNEAAKCDIVCSNCHRERTWAKGAHK